MAHLILFSKPQCTQCDTTKRALHRKGLDVDSGDFTVIDVSEDVEAYNFVRSLGYLQVPVVVVTDGTYEELIDTTHPAMVLESWSGFRPDSINTMLEEYPELGSILELEPIA